LDPGIEGDSNPLTNSLNFRSLQVIAQLFGLFVHMTANECAGGATNGSANDCPHSGVVKLISDNSSDHSACTRANGSAFDRSAGVAVE
jgi:hypothetical protein